MNDQMIYRLIPLVMAEVAFIPKLREHSEQHWVFRGFEDFLQYFRPALLKHGLFVVPEVLDTDTSERITANQKKMHHVLARVAYTIFAPDGSCVRAVVIGESWDTSDNASTKALDDAFTSFLTQVFCVPVADSIENLLGRAEKRQEQRREEPREKKPPPAPVNQAALRRNEACTKLRKENSRLEFTEQQLCKWLTSHFVMTPPPIHLSAALQVLTIEQIEEAVKLFEAKKKRIGEREKSETKEAS